MPFLRKQTFVKSKPPKDLKPDDDVFFFDVTGEIFTDYDQFFERVILCNSLVWTCEMTGKSGLTYSEAVESEQKAKKTIAFPPYLQKPLLFLTRLTHRTRLLDLNEDIFQFARSRYFIGEHVEVVTQDNEKKSCKIIKVIAKTSPVQEKKSPTKPVVNGVLTVSDSDSDVICLDDDEEKQASSENKSLTPTFENQHEGDSKGDCGIAVMNYDYIVQEIKGNNIYILPASSVSRKKALVTRDRCKLYFKQHCDSYGSGIWKVKDKYLNRWKIREMKFEDFFGGPEPNFPKSEVKRIKKGPAGGKIRKSELKKKMRESDMTEEDRVIAEAKQEMKEKKKQERAEKRQEKLAMEREIQRMKEENERLMKMSVDERAAEKERMRLQRLAEREKKKEELKEQWLEEKQRRKEERDKEREKKRQEKKEQEEHMREWKKARDDIECDDLKPLPAATPVCTHVPSELFGDVVMVMEYLSGFSDVLGAHNENLHALSVEEIARCLQDTDSSSIFGDLLKLLLTAIFRLQEDEEEEEKEDNEDPEGHRACPEGNNREGVSSYEELVNQADKAAQWPQLVYSTPLRKLPMDSFSITEILRLHFMSSGAQSSLSNAKFQYQQRGGYTSLDDAGLEFRRNEPHIIKDLSEKNVFDLPPGDKLKIISALIQQCLTYVLSRDAIEDSQEKLRSLRNDLRQIQWADDRRRKDESAFWWKKRCEERAKEKEMEAQRKEQKKKEKEEQLRQDESGKDGVTLSDSQKTEESMNSSTTVSSQQKVSPSQAERKSSRLKDSKAKDDEIDLLAENIDWEKMTQTDREKLKAKQEKEEFELNKKIWEALRGSSVAPLGRDRTFRRFWIFPSLPGLYVEDNEENVTDDFFQLLEQQGSKVASDDKSTSSDKENESFDHSNIPASKDSEEPMEVSEDKVVNLDPLEEEKSVSCVSVQEQIAARNKVHWSYYNTQEQLEKLIDSLNPRGFREGPLKTTLQEQKAVLCESINQCPVDVLSLRLDDSVSENDKRKRDAIQYQSLKSRNKTTQGAVKNSSAEEFIELNLREMLLDLEERICFGTLGALKVKDRVLWREAIENGGYNPMAEDTPTNGKLKGQVQMCKDGSVEEEDSRQLVVHDLSRALVQIAQMIEPKYLITPLGEGDKTKKQKGKAKVTKDKKTSKGKKVEADSSDDSSSDDENPEESKPLPKTPLERWEESLKKATSLSQIFLHLSILDLSVTWTKSALHARCRICRRKGDGEKMLLCDGCDRGHHMYCLKPQVKKIPQGDWFCPNCRPKDVVRTPRKRRRSTFEVEEEEEEEEEEVLDVSSADSDSEDSDDEESQDSSSEEESQVDDTEDEKEEVTYKVKFLTKTKKRQPSSGRSTPTSVVSKASNRSSKTSKSVEKPAPNSAKAGSSKKGQTSASKARNRSSLEHGEVKSSSRSNRKSVDLGASNDRPTSRSSRLGQGEPGSSERSGRTQRSSLENAIKRKLELNEEDSPPSKKVILSASRGNDKTSLLKECEDLVQELSQRDEAWPFLAPVTRRDAPDYFDIVKQPMDFATMRNKINHFEYKNPGEMIEDVRRIFSNCEQYNMPTAPEFQACKKLSRYFERKIKDAKLDKKAETVKSPTKRGTPPSPVKRSTRTR